MRRNDGSFESANTPAAWRQTEDIDDSLFKAMITRVYYVDEQNNISKGARNAEVSYEAIIVGGSREGQIVTNVRDISSLGGEYNASERIWRATSKKSFVKGSGTPLEEQDGDLVYIQFLNGNDNFAVILGGAKHFKNTTTGAKKAEGPRVLWEYNGIRVLINNKGELTVTQYGGKVDTDKETFVPEKEEAASIQMLDKKVIIKDKSENIITIDATSKKITIAAPEAFEVTTKMMKVMADNAFTLETSTVNITASGTVNISGQQVLLGGGGPGVARLGDTAIGTGAHGVTVVSTIINGSFTVKAG